MRPTGLFVAIFFSTALALTCAIGWAQTAGPKAAGEAVYKQRCAMCHEQTNPRIPPRSTLNQMPATRILRALDFGAMMTVAYPMNRDERASVAAYLGTNTPAISYPASAYCSDRNVTVSAKPKAAWNGWSPARQQCSLSVRRRRGVEH